MKHGDADRSGFHGLSTSPRIKQKPGNVGMSARNDHRCHKDHKRCHGYHANRLSWSLCRSSVPWSPPNIPGVRCTLHKVDYYRFLSVGQDIKKCTSSTEEHVGVDCSLVVDSRDEMPRQTRETGVTEAYRTFLQQNVR